MWKKIVYARETSMSFKFLFLFVRCLLKTLPKNSAKRPRQITPNIKVFPNRITDLSIKKKEKKNIFLFPQNADTVESALIIRAVLTMNLDTFLERYIHT